ncbi:DedA family protein [Candidatus Pacearchaeota archaeon]|nr:DedA family protein [Candidatus Pacearchaeota archaeon]
MAEQKKERYEFIKETSNKQRLIVFFISLFVILLLLSSIITLYIIFKDSINQSQSLHAFKSFLGNEVKNASPLGVFYASFTGAFFFMFTPIELFFTISLRNGNPPLLVLFFTLAGIIPAYLINYFIGAKAGRFILNFISKKKIYAARRKVNKYGVYAILLFSILPLPADLLTLGLGMTKYNILRLFSFIIIGSLIKYGFLILIFKGIF